MTDFLKMLFSLSAGGSLMSLLLFGSKLILGGKLSSRFWYYLWIPVLLRLVLPVGGLVSYEHEPVPQESAYISTAPQTLPAQDADGRSDAVLKHAAPAHAFEPNIETSDHSPQTEPKPESGARISLNIWQAIFLVWLLGLLVKLCLNIGGYALFRRKLSLTLKRVYSEERRLFNTMSGTRHPTLARSPAVTTPLLLGLKSPLLVLPDTNYDDETLRNIFMHELTHYRRRDMAYKWLAVLICSIHWFNPLTYLILREINRYSELSCDESVLKSLNESEARFYGDTLLNIAAASAVPKGAIAMTFATEKRDLKERLVQIMKFKSRPKTSIALILILSLLLCACGAVSGPKTDSQPAPTPQSAEIPDNAVTVSTVDELLAAIAPNATIILKSGTYDLSTASDYGPSAAKYYTWTDTYDGSELQISCVNDLSIIAEKPGEVLICTQPRYANVLLFSSCNNLTLRGLTVGHTEEHSTCTGGVLYFDSCDNTSVDRCSLYGCGTVGVYACYCRSMRVTDTKIYDCSYSAASIISCQDMLFDGCEIYDCVNTFIFNFHSTSNSAVINSIIHDNDSSSLLSSGNSGELYLGGLKVRDNSFENPVFSLSGYRVTVEKCAFENNQFTDWLWPEDMNEMGSGRCFAPDGSELDHNALNAMTRAEKVTWQPKPMTDTGDAPEASDDGYIHVSTVDELLASIAPNAKIYLEDGSYDLSTASNYGEYIGKYYRWMDRFDGPMLSITYVEGLELKGAGKDTVEILSVPRLADVIDFHLCSNLTLSGFTAGHTEQGACTGGVLHFQNCEDVDIDSCGLFGCGTNGITTVLCNDMRINAVDIYDCSVNGADILTSDNISFTDCRVFDNKLNSITVEDSHNVSFNGTELFTSSRNTVNADGSITEEPKETNFGVLVENVNGGYVAFIPELNSEFTMHPGDKFILFSGLPNAEYWSAEWSYEESDALIFTSLDSDRMRTVHLECVKASNKPVNFECFNLETNTTVSFTVYCLEE